MTTTISPDPASSPIDAIATFTAARSELFGNDPLVGSAELARAVCRGAQQTISVFAVTTEWMRRLDGWLDHHGFVTQAAATSPADPVIGSLSNRANARDVLAKVVHAMVGECPTQPLEAPAAHTLDTLGSSAMPPDTDWFVLVLVGAATTAPFTHGIAAMASARRLGVAEFRSIAAPVDFVGATVDEWQTMLAGTVRAATPSLSELLASESPR